MRTKREKGRNDEDNSEMQFLNSRFMAVVTGIQSRESKDFKTSF